MFRLIFVLFTLVQLSYANIIIENEKAIYNDFQISYFFDDSKKLNFEEITDENFTSKISNKFTLGYTDKPIWFKIDIKNNSNTDEFVLQLNEPFWDKLDLYHKIPDGWEKHKAGLLTPIKSREIQDAFPSFHITVPKGESSAVYINAQTVNGYLGAFSLYKSKEFFQPGRFDINTFYYLYAAVLFIILILNIILYFATKEQLNLYYIGYVTFYILFISMFSSFYLYMDLPGWSHGLHTIGAIVLMFMSLYSRTFFELKKSQPWVKNLFRFFTYTFFVFAITMSLNIPNWTLVFNIFAFIFMASLFVLAINTPKEKNRQVGYYIYALIIYMPTMGMMALTFDSLIAYTDITRFSFLAGGIIELILFSLILGSRYHTDKFEKIHLQEVLLKQKQDNEEQLEKKIKERTLELEKAEEKYRLLFEMSEYPMWIFHDDIIVLSNDSAVKIFDYETQNDFDQLHPLDLSPEFQENNRPSYLEIEKHLQVAFEKGYNRFEWILKKKNGDLFFTEVNLTKIPYEDSFAFFVIANDITNQKNHEKEILKAQEVAEKANQAKSEFLANMSHEIRTPMTGMLGFIEQLKKSEKDPDRLNKFNIVHTSGEVLLNIINDILDFSKIESKKLEIDNSPFSIKELLENSIDIFQQLASTKNISVLTIIDTNLPPCIIGDSTRLKQVLFNLISNSIKFTEENGHITLKTHYSDENKTTYISVIDSGVGIAKEKLEKIFAAFTQEDTSTTRKYGGTGLGLTISSRLVGLMGGELKVKSTMGKGSEFYFEIPIVTCSEDTVSNDLDANVMEIDESITLEAHVLVVEDNKTNQMLIGMILDDHNITYDIANDGAEAVLSFKQNSYDAILMDENMPIMNGIEATKLIIELEEEKAQAHTPIIAVTANALIEDRERFLDAGMDDYISKPYTEDDIMNVLRKYLLS